MSHQVGFRESVSGRGSARAGARSGLSPHPEPRPPHTVQLWFARPASPTVTQGYLRFTDPVRADQSASFIIPAYGRWFQYPTAGCATRRCGTRRSKLSASADDAASQPVCRPLSRRAAGLPGRHGQAAASRISDFRCPWLLLDFPRREAVTTQRHRVACRCAGGLSPRTARCPERP